MPSVIATLVRTQSIICESKKKRQLFEFFFSDTAWLWPYAESRRFAIIFRIKFFVYLMSKNNHDNPKHMNPFV